MSARGFQRLADDIRRQIMSGNLKLGARLPSEADLAHQYGVSRSTVREALRVLESQSLLVTTRGATGGSWINHPNQEQIAAYLETGFRLMTLASKLSSEMSPGMLSVDALLEVRAIVEIPAAELAAARRTHEQLTLLEESVDRHDGNGEMHAVHRSFHDILFDATHNPLLATVSQPIFAVIEDRFARDRAPGEVWTKVAQDHRALYEAIRDQDTKRAGETMRQHLAHLSKAYLAMERTSIRATASRHTSSR
jgi:GntR family transcriptional repressor for pyruvate dehydrogenase complex